MLVEFDKLKRDYQEHQHEIHSKLISIMGERLTTHCKSLSEVQWDEEGAEAPNTYIKQLVKETVTLHKVLGKYLGPVASEVRAHLSTLFLTMLIFA
jgi:vacuolar protein sorting-associated protein 54